MAGNVCSIMALTSAARGYDNSSPAKTKKYSEMELSLRQNKNRRHCKNCGTVISKRAKECTFCYKPIVTRQYNRVAPKKKVDTKLYCHNCKKQVSKFCKECKHCGVVLKTGVPGLTPIEAHDQTVERIKFQLALG